MTELSKFLPKPGPGVLSLYEEFTTSGTWTKDPNATWVYVEILGGGGGGGAALGDNAYGGIGGQFDSRLFRASDLGPTENVIVGAGGTGGFTNSTARAPGNSGGDSRFGDHIYGYGGMGGRAGSERAAVKKYITEFRIPGDNTNGIFGENLALTKMQYAGGTGGLGRSSGLNSYDLPYESEYSGNGGIGDGGNVTSVSGQDGEFPAGGGGGAGNYGSSGRTARGGDGAGGCVRVYQF